ncbi:MAG: Na/Pi cotransporter family protein [Thermodesulfobacteriota bacterium]|nr:Na/Pi cotransporter family protein [Thermodesulfobacteriota bacterium]
MKNNLRALHTNSLPWLSVLILFFILFFLWPMPATVPADDTADVTFISWSKILFGISGGLAFFLYGMEKMSEGMKSTAGNKMRAILASLTKNRFIAMVVGSFVTMVIQSSSATTVMLVSFVQAGLLNLSQCMGVILGADIGTTITAQMIAFKLTDYAILMVAVGFFLHMLGKTRKVRDIGDILLGFGILFFGMKLMSDVMAPLRTYPAFIHLMQEMENPFSGILLGAVFTAIVQSSSATTGLLIVLAQQGLISLEAGIPILFGANIGTCVTAVLAGINATREAKRVAIAHVIFKIAGVCLFLFWIPRFAQLIRDLALIFGSDTARQIANAHTIFNVSIGLIFLPFVNVFARFIYVIFPEKAEAKSAELKTWYIEDEAMLKTPSLAIDLARSEISRMAKVLGRMLTAVIIPFVSDEKHISSCTYKDCERKLLISEIPTRDAVFPELSLIEGIDLREKKIDYLEEKISTYLARIAKRNITKQEATEVFGMVSIVKDMESIGDIIHRNLLPLIVKKKGLTYDFCEEGKEELLIYQSKVLKQLRLLETAFGTNDLKAACNIMHKEKKYLALEAQYRAKHLKRIIAEKQESVKTSEIHMELMDLMKQILLYSANIAQTYIQSSPEKNALDSEPEKS